MSILRKSNSIGRSNSDLLASLSPSSSSSHPGPIGSSPSSPSLPSSSSSSSSPSPSPSPSPSTSASASSASASSSSARPKRKRAQSGLAGKKQAVVEALQVGKGRRNTKRTKGGTETVTGAGERTGTIGMSEGVTNSVEANNNHLLLIQQQQQQLDFHLHNNTLGTITATPQNISSSTLSSLASPPSLGNKNVEPKQAEGALKAEGGPGEVNHLLDSASFHNSHLQHHQHQQQQQQQTPHPSQDCSLHAPAVLPQHPLGKEASSSFPSPSSSSSSTPSSSSSSSSRNTTSFRQQLRDECAATLAARVTHAFRPMHSPTIQGKPIDLTDENEIQQDINATNMKNSKQANRADGEAGERKEEQGPTSSSSSSSLPSSSPSLSSSQLNTSESQSQELLSTSQSLSLSNSQGSLLSQPSFDLSSSTSSLPLSSSSSSSSSSSLSSSSEPSQPVPKPKRGRRAKAGSAPKREPKKTTTRSDSSLCLVTSKFVDLLRSNSGQLNLNEAAEELNAPKRRIYDITNVLEGIGLLTKLSKNTIQWKGRGFGLPDQDQEVQQMTSTVTELQQLDATLTSQIQEQESIIRQLHDESNAEEFGFVTHEDIRGITSLAGETLIAIKAPQGTKLEVPDPDEGVNPPNKRFAMQLTSNTGPIDVYLINEAEDQANQATDTSSWPLDQDDDSLVKLSSFLDETSYLNDMYDDEGLTDLFQNNEFYDTLADMATGSLQPGVPIAMDSMNQ